MAGVTSLNMMTISRAFLSPQCEIIGYSSSITPSLIFPPRVTSPITLSTASSRRRNNNNTPPPITSTNNNKKNTSSKVLLEEDGFDEDSIEALFSLLEEDLKNDLSSGDGDEDLTEEDLAKLEKELEGSDDELSGLLNSEKSETDDDDEDEEERPVELKKWQLRRLASALKIGRRKTSIKSLAAELCLDRAVVLDLLRDPPPNLLLLSAALPDRIVQTTLEPESKPVEPPSVEFTKDVLETQPEVKLPVHMMQSRWSMQKRLKKVQLETLERVYNRTKRPTNAMISSVVHVTNLPRKRVVKWFEDKRAEDGVPHNRLPYQPSTSESMLIN